MVEQWFLDLDGVKSGPYQTSEILRLISEGEALPHHLISTELKSTQWKTILEWRISQTKSIELEKPAPKPEPIPPKPEPVIEKKLEEKLTSEIPAPRDPMAEMFDMIQTTRQKRESQSQLAHAQAHANSTLGSMSSNLEKNDSKKNVLGLNTRALNTIIIAAVITLVGFTLGQIFQKKSNPELSTKPEINRSEIAIQPPKEESTPKIETVDRSNERMTIRAQVPVRNEPISRPTPVITPIPTQHNPVSGHSNPPQDAAELQELKDLKKELMELKALKEEMKKNEMYDEMGNDGAIERAGEAPEEYDVYGNPIPPKKNKKNPENQPKTEIYY